MTINLLSEALLEEYEGLVQAAGREASDEELLSALVQDAAWTESGGREVLRLAQEYGTSILRNALALAWALEIEDGSKRL